MSSKRYTDEFKAEAVNQVIERGYRGAEVSQVDRNAFLEGGILTVC